MKNIFKLFKRIIPTKFKENFNILSFLNKEEDKIQNLVNKYDSINARNDTNDNNINPFEEDNKITNIINFQTYKNIFQLSSESDADTTGGDTFYEIKYNLANESSIIIS
jgi:hypothetical protein